MERAIELRVRELKFNEFKSLKELVDQQNQSLEDLKFRVEKKQKLPAKILDKVPPPSITND